jgi:hypothetical protein
MWELPHLNNGRAVALFLSPAGLSPDSLWFIFRILDVVGCRTNAPEDSSPLSTVGFITPRHKRLFERKGSVFTSVVHPFVATSPWLAVTLESRAKLPLRQWTDLVHNSDIGETGITINRFMNLRDLFEAPISDISHVGNWEKNSSFRDPRDRKLLQNPKAITKIKGMWKFPEETNVNIILVNSPDANKWTEEGLVTPDWIETNMPRDWPQIEPLLRDDEVNVIYTNNKGSERVPLTGWIMAHRFAHALWATANRGSGNSSAGYYFKEALEEFNSAMRDVMDRYGIRNHPVSRNMDYMRDSYSYYRTDYGTGYNSLTNVMPLRAFCHMVGTFRSAREKNIRNPVEFLLELFAQYTFTGKMTLNDPPRSFKYGHNYYSLRSEEDQQYIERRMEAMTHTLRDYFDSAVGYSDGAIFVM